VEIAISTPLPDDQAVVCSPCPFFYPPGHLNFPPIHLSNLATKPALGLLTDLLLVTFYPCAAIAITKTILSKPAHWRLSSRGQKRIAFLFVHSYLYFTLSTIATSNPSRGPRATGTHIGQPLYPFYLPILRGTAPIHCMFMYNMQQT
jgi:hypothetical protein